MERVTVQQGKMCVCGREDTGKRSIMPCISNSFSSNLLPASISPPHCHRDWQSRARYERLPSDTLMAFFFGWRCETPPEVMYKLSKENAEGNPEKNRSEGGKRRAWQVFLLRLRFTLISVWGLAQMLAPVMHVCNTSNHVSLHTLPCAVWLINSASPRHYFLLQLDINKFQKKSVKWQHAWLCVGVCVCCSVVKRMGLTANETLIGGRTQSTELDTLLRLIETASGTNRLRDGVHAMAGEGKEKEEEGKRQGASEIGGKTKWHC